MFITFQARIKDVNVEIGEDRVIVESRRSGEVLDVFLPLILNPDKVSAQFSTSSHILHFIVPLVKD